MIWKSLYNSGDVNLEICQYSIRKHLSRITLKRKVFCFALPKKTSSALNQLVKSHHQIGDANVIKPAVKIKGTVLLGIGKKNPY